MHRRVDAVQVKQALDVSDSLDAPRPLDELGEHADGRHLAAELYDAVLGVDRDLALRHRRVAEELALDLARKGGVVEVTRCLVSVTHALRGPERRRPGALSRSRGPAPCASQGAGGTVGRVPPAAPAAHGVEEEQRRTTGGGASGEGPGELHLPAPGRATADEGHLTCELNGHGSGLDRFRGCETPTTRTRHLRACVLRPGVRGTPSR